MITAEGRLQNADYTDNNGTKHYAMEVNVDQLNFCGDGKPSGNAQQAAQGDVGNYPQNYPPQQPNGYNAPQGGYYDGYYEQAPPPQNYGRR